VSTRSGAVNGAAAPIRPRIGISSYAESADWSYWRDVPAVLVPLAYVDSVRVAGGLPYLIPPIPELAEDPHMVIDSLDGLVIVGGSDLDPTVYGAAPDPASAGFHPTRDLVEAALIQAAIEVGLPYLGVCRGLQLLNVVRGGTLVQHVPDIVADPLRHRPALGQYGRHPVAIDGASRLGELIGTSVEVMSCHHQAPGRIGEGLRLVGRDTTDDTIEALEEPTQDFCIGVQWHPEEDLDGSGQTLFRALIEHARNNSRMKGR